MSTRPEYEPLAPVIRLAPEPTPDPYERADRKRRLLLAIVAGAFLALVGLLAAWTIRSAAGHYERGREALVAERYSTAIQEFNAARIIVFSYRDAEALSAEAAEALNAGMRQESVAETRLEKTVRDYVKLADAKLDRGDGVAAERALANARDLVPTGQLSTDPFTLALLQTLSQRLRIMGRQALTDGRWAGARICAGALYAIEPDDAVAGRLSKKARQGARLQDKLAEARAAARRGEWRRALRLATAVLDAWPGFRGAAAVVGRARAALAPKPAPAPEPTAAATTAPPQTTPTAPPPPPPPP